MRIGYSDDEDWPGQFALFQANCRRSLRGQTGQCALRQLEAALLALPKPRLIAHELQDVAGDVCAIGALVRYQGITPKADPEFEMEHIGVECGMPLLVAWKVVEQNDIEFDTRYVADPVFHRVLYTPEERYDAMLAWVRQQLGTVP